MAPRHCLEVDVTTPAIILLIKKATFDLTNLDEVKDEKVINVEQHDMSIFLLN